MEKERKAFEAWIAEPPYERAIVRWSDDATKHAWPGQYCDLSVQLAWESWIESRRVAAMPNTVDMPHRNPIK